MKIARLDTSRELGTLLDQDQIVLKVAGLEVPEDDATAAERRRFNAALIQAVKNPEEEHTDEIWWRDIPSKINTYTGVDQSCSVEEKEAVNIQELINGTRRSDLAFQDIQFPDVMCKTRLAEAIDLDPIDGDVRLAGVHVRGQHTAEVRAVLNPRKRACLRPPPPPPPPPWSTSLWETHMSGFTTRPSTVAEYARAA
ncbi:hypothetical protein LTS07_001373 [Exophiala sideris]|uniref:Uncharacterized protein n=1 Tax=Exophiala sideris TaxID=1016849 RepID=A0ABR0JN96_9EURO|nr:hypothetical protein LTS07_001373 [Exophiala sideris]KAK5067388.1 hypothetical protein LTR69_001375 [Exophiala sideris]KAK5182721.1 hypothetical protein LTR44_005112 [Eurotiomycetes sp. CCFEE 6388]